MKEICMKIMKNGNSHLFELNTEVMAESTGRIVIKYNDPISYDVCFPERTKYIVFTDHKFNILDINAVAWKIIGHLQEHHPSFKFDILDINAGHAHQFIISARWLADVKELHQTKFIPRNGTVEFITYIQNGDSKPIYRTVGTYSVTDPNPEMYAFHLTYRLDKFSDKHETCVRKKDFLLNNLTSVGKSIAQDIRWRFSCIYGGVDYYVQQSEGRIIIKCYKTFKVKRPFISVNAANIASMIRGVEDLKFSAEFWADPRNVTTEARKIIKAYHGYEKETKTMTPKTYFDKVIVNGPATIGFKKNGFKKNYYTGDTDKYIIKKADGDAYDLEKAFLMLYAKSQFDSDEEFHKWFKVNMKMFKEAYDEAHPDIDSLPAVDVAAISKGINESLERMSKKLREYKEKINREYGVTKEDDIPKKNVVPKDRIWAEDEVKLLKRHYKSSSISDIASALGRSEAAVKSKAHRLGLDKKEE